MLSIGSSLGPPVTVSSTARKNLRRHPSCAAAAVVDRGLHLCTLAASASVVARRVEVADTDHVRGRYSHSLSDRGQPRRFLHHRWKIEADAVVHRTPIVVTGISGVPPAGRLAGRVRSALGASPPDPTITPGGVGVPRPRRGGPAHPTAGGRPPPGRLTSAAAYAEIVEASSASQAGPYLRTADVSAILRGHRAFLRDAKCRWIVGEYIRPRHALRLGR